MKKKSSVSQNLVIVGAGFAGVSLAKEIQTKRKEARILAFLDDDPAKIGTSPVGIPVLGPIHKLSEFHLDIHEAIIAIPSATKGQLRAIYQKLMEESVDKISILPGISQIIDGEAHLVLTREIDPQDLLGRNPVRISLKQSLAYLRGKRVLITGAGGSIGSELARQLLSGGAQRLYLLGHGENSIYDIDRELRLLQKEGVGEKAIIVPIIGELKDPDYLRFLLQRLKADVIFHAAAYKHVPMMENNPVEAVHNNVWGTKNLVEAALAAGTPRFVLVSTDKAVHPHSVYGATKKISEEIVLQTPLTPSTQFMVVRFGNVLGSRGSIVPLFRQQILAGGPVTITDPKASRYFMTIPEASSLVLQTGGVGRPGELYLLDMGEPLLIEELAQQMIRFYSKQPHKDIPITYIGLRPGEKLEEHLNSEEEEPVPTEYPRINRLVRRTHLEGLESLLKDLYPVCHWTPEKDNQYRNRVLLRKILAQYIPTLEEKNHEPEY